MKRGRIIHVNNIVNPNKQHFWKQFEAIVLTHIIFTSFFPSLSTPGLFYSIYLARLRSPPLASLSLSLILSSISTISLISLSAWYFISLDFRIQFSGLHYSGILLHSIFVHFFLALVKIYTFLHDFFFEYYRLDMRI